MSAGADVIVEARFDRESLDLLTKLMPEAIQRALQKAKDKILKIGRKLTPERTGRLRASFDAAVFGQTIALKWDAVDSGYHYAHVVEYGRTDRNPFTGRYYAESTKMEAKRIVRDCLLEELRKVRP